MWGSRRRGPAVRRLQLSAALWGGRRHPQRGSRRPGAGAGGGAPGETVPAAVAPPPAAENGAGVQTPPGEPASAGPAPVGSRRRPEIDRSPPGETAEVDEAPSPKCARLDSVTVHSESPATPATRSPPPLPPPPPAGALEPGHDFASEFLELGRLPVELDRPLGIPPQGEDDSDRGSDGPGPAAKPPTHAVDVRDRHGATAVLPAGAGTPEALHGTSADRHPVPDAGTGGGVESADLGSAETHRQRGLGAAGDDDAPGGRPGVGGAADSGRRTDSDLDPDVRERLLRLDRQVSDVHLPWRDPAAGVQASIGLQLMLQARDAALRQHREARERLRQHVDSGSGA